jgi:hypothetical protein
MFTFKPSSQTRHYNNIIGRILDSILDDTSFENSLLYIHVYPFATIPQSSPIKAILISNTDSVRNLVKGLRYVAA